MRHWLFRTLGDKWAIAWVLIHRAGVAYAQGDHQLAAALNAESLVLCRELRTSWGTADCLDGLGWLAAAQGQPRRAARLCGAAAGLRDTVGLSPIVRDEYERNLAAVRSGLTDKGFAAAWAQGQALTLEDAVREALAPGRADAPEAAAPGGEPIRLTRREREVAALIAGGLSNPQIAAELVITRRTAANHVEHILNKLGFHARTQVAVWAAEHGLGVGPA